MAEITKVTTPMIPKENLGNKYKAITDQAFDLTDPSKVHKPGQEGKILDHDRQGGQVLGENVGRAAILPLLRDTGDVADLLQRLILLVQTGLSAADIMNSSPIKELLESLYIPQGDMLKALQEQQESSVLFRGEAFDLLRGVLQKFDSQGVKDAAANLLKAFEQNVNIRNSVKTILYNSENILDYMFSTDREQFAGYLAGLENMLLLGEAAESPAPEQQTAQAGANLGQLGVSPKEAAQILKNNLLPLLGEIVVKYHQNDRIRDYVMVVVHNIVRVDRGTPEALREAVNRLVQELRQVANLPEGFGKHLGQTLLQDAQAAKQAQNQVLSKLVDLISETLRSPDSSPASVRQAENLLMSLLQDQSSMMNLLHFILPLNTPQGKTLAELYVDPDSQESTRRGGGRGQSRKLFLSFEAERHGAFELSFVQTGEYVDFGMWCPAALVGGLGAMRRSFTDIMLNYGFTMTSFQVEEYQKPHSIAEVFPSLLKRKVGIDVKI